MFSPVKAVNLSQEKRTLERTLLMDQPRVSTSDSLHQINPARQSFLLDLVVYLAVMFAIREIYFDGMSFIANGLFWSLTTLIVASWRMKVRGVSWTEIGLCRPENVKKALLATGFILALSVASIVVFNILLDLFSWNLTADTSGESAVSKFGQLKDNWLLFLAIIPFIWLESFLEEILDRGFLMNWIERLFSSTWFATVLAVVLQAVIFGFRHSYDLSERSITVGLIGLAMGIGYVAFGRNLWPLILAHCLLNTLSMLERVA